MGHGFKGRLEVHSPYRGRASRAKMENQREPYSGRSFPGFDDIDLSFDELESLVRNDRTDWKAALESIKGIYVITDVVSPQARATRQTSACPLAREASFDSRHCQVTGSGEVLQPRLRD
jgi:hypothetical protein